MELVVKYFNELKLKELYEILKVREAVFIIEQNCLYQDIDRIDYDSLHIFYENNGEILAYLRAFFMDNSKEVVRMGRVLTIERGVGLGAKLLKSGIETIRNKMGAKRIFIEAQTYAIGYYEREGFKVCSEEFLEDGIPHVQMILELE